MTGPQGRERTPPEVAESIRDLYHRGYTAIVIHETMPAVAKKMGFTPPSLRTVQRVVSRERTTDESAPWAFEDMDPGAARTVLDFLAEAIVESQGRVTTVNSAEARLIGQIRQQVHFDVNTTLRLARLYLQRRTKNLDTADLDAFLAFAPWTDADAAGRYWAAVQQGFIGAPPILLARHVQPYVDQMERFLYVNDNPEKPSVPGAETLLDLHSVAGLNRIARLTLEQTDTVFGSDDETPTKRRRRRRNQ